MSCNCFRSDRNSRSYFHWPNFTFSHSLYSINPRRIRSTFSLAGKQKPSHRLRRRHTLHNGTIIANLKRPGDRKSRTFSFKSTKTAPPAVDELDMNESYKAPPGPPPGHSAANPETSHVSWETTRSRNSEMTSTRQSSDAHISSQNELQSEKALPPAYRAPPGPPPSHQMAKEQPPPGPPPSYDQDGIQPPPGPPPSHQQEEDTPPPYDPWLAVPDNALLPPPPAIREERSPTANATWDEAAQGHAWCKQNPLWQPRRHDPQTLSRISRGEIRLTAPPNARFAQVNLIAKGVTRVRTSANCTDTTFLSNIPLYTTTAPPRTIYYEIRVISMGGNSGGSNQEADAGVAIGFCAPPYPFWRLPGWHRASLAVHGDDGRRYVDNSFGGQDFTSAFRKNDVVGIGMTFTAAGYAGGKIGCEIFFTRNGKKEGGWDLHEERDRDVEEGDVTGLEGRHDLLAAVGCFGGVEFEAILDPAAWKYKIKR